MQEQETILFNNKKKLTDILSIAEKHYEKYNKTKNKNNLSDYLFQMRLLTQRIAFFYTKLEHKAKKDLGKYVATILTQTDPTDYSKQQLDSLAYVIDKLENEEINQQVFAECISKLKRIML